MSLFNSSVFPGHFQPASCIVEDRQVALAMVDVKCVFERSLSHPRVLCWKKDITNNVSAPAAACITCKKFPTPPYKTARRRKQHHKMVVLLHPHDFRNTDTDEKKKTQIVHLRLSSKQKLYKVITLTLI